MASGAPRFLEDMSPYIPDVARTVERSIEAVMGGGPLDPKVKRLIMLALDIAAGSESGTAGLASACRSEGATEEEIADVVRTVFLQAGLARLATARHAFARTTSWTPSDSR